ncbi:DUF4390 domain-containing protein [Melaminivora sp.]
MLISSDCPEHAQELAARRAFLRALAGWGGVGLLALHEPVPAQARGEVTELLVEHTDAGVLLSAAWRMVLPTLLENALYQGVALHFIAEAKVVRPRWYWSDKTVAHAVRYFRLSYQPLTRRWRLVQSSTNRESSEAGTLLGQSFEEFSDAVAALQRLARWKIADASALDDDGGYSVNFQFRLDTSQMPRPLQLGAVGSTNWNVSLTRRIELNPAEGVR